MLIRRQNYKRQRIFVNANAQEWVKQSLCAHQKEWKFVLQNRIPNDPKYLCIKKRFSCLFGPKQQKNRLKWNKWKQSEEIFFSEKGFKKAPNGKQLCNRTFEKSFATAQRLLLLQEFMFRGQNVLDFIVDIIALLCSAPNYTDIQQ